MVSHSWITRSFFPKRLDSSRNSYILEFNSKEYEDMFAKFYAILQEFSVEVGGSFANPYQIDAGRYLLEGPKGFSIIEVAPAYTQEEFDQINNGPELDLSVWEGMFNGSELPKESTPETDRSD